MKRIDRITNSQSAPTPEGRCIRRQPSQSPRGIEHRQIKVFRTSVQREVRKDFADHTSEFEPMAREASSNYHAIVCRMFSNHEMFIWRIREQTRLHRKRRTGGIR